MRQREALWERIDRLWRATGRYSSEREFLRKCRVSQGYLSQLKARFSENPATSIDVEMAYRMARELGITVEDLRGDVPLHIPDETYPSRSPAVAAARLLNYPESAIASVMAETPSVDPGPKYWFRRIDAEAEVSSGSRIRPEPGGGSGRRSERRR